MKPTNCVVLLGLHASLILNGTLAAPPRSFSSRQWGLADRRHLHRPSARLSVKIRGGSTPPSSSDDPYSTTNQQDQYAYTSQEQQSPFDAAQQQQPLTDESDPFHETVQERVDTWRNQQRAHAAAAKESPRDDQGRMKLLTSVSKGSRAIIFFLLMWRNIHLYEVADQTHKGLARLVCVVPLIVLFIANLAGVVSSLTSPSHSAKKRLKAILNLDKLMEVLLIAFYFVRLTFVPSEYTPREMYIANTFHSIFFILQCQAFTRLSWDEAAAPTVSSYAMPQDQRTMGNEQEEGDDYYYDDNDYYQNEFQQQAGTDQAPAAVSTESDWQQTASGSSSPPSNSQY